MKTPDYMTKQQLLATDAPNATQTKLGKTVTGNEKKVGTCMGQELHNEFTVER